MEVKSIFVYLFSNLRNLSAIKGVFSVVNCEGHDLTAFIASPKDIIVATEPNDEDHVTWLLDNEQYFEALDFTKNRKLASHSYAAIGREYIRFLIETDDLELAAQKCPAFLRFVIYCGVKIYKAIQYRS